MEDPIWPWASTNAIYLREIRMNLKLHSVGIHYVGFTMYLIIMSALAICLHWLCLSRRF